MEKERKTRTYMNCDISCLHRVRNNYVFALFEDFLVERQKKKKKKAPMPQESSLSDSSVLVLAMLALDLTKCILFWPQGRGPIISYQNPVTSSWTRLSSSLLYVGCSYETDYVYFLRPYYIDDCHCTLVMIHNYNARHIRLHSRLDIFGVSSYAIYNI